MKRSFLLMSISLSIWGIGEGMFIYFQPLYLQELGADPIKIGAILGGIGTAMAIAHLPAGFLADRFGRRPLLWSAWGLASLAAWIMALAETLPVFVLGAGLYGTTAFVAGPMNGYITAARRDWSVARALTTVFSAYNAGAILGPLLGGYVGENFGLRYSFIFSGLLFILSTTFILRIEPQPVEPVEPGEKYGRWREIHSPKFILFVAIVLLVTFCMFLPQPLSQNFLQNERELNLTQVGWLIAARSSGVVFFNLVLGRLNARHGYLIALAAMALFMMLVWQGQSLPVYLLGYFMLGSFQTARVLAAAQGRSLVKANNMGMAYGILETTGATAFIFAPPIAGLLYTIAPELPYITGLVGLSIASVIAFLFIPLKPEEIA
jgi:MFS family permease